MRQFSLLFTCYIFAANLLYAAPSDNLANEIYQHLKKNYGQGVAVAAVTKDSILFLKGIGLRDQENNLKVREDTIFRAASVSKIFVGLALAKLLRQHHIDLQTPLEQLLPEVKIINPWPSTHPVLINQLLEHTAGLQEVIIRWKRPDEERRVNLDYLLNDVIKPVTLTWPPGSRTTYSNYGYIIAAKLIEQLSGQKFEDYIQQKIFLPIEMKNSAFHSMGIDKTRLAKGYQSKPTRPLEFTDDYYWPAAGLLSTIQDLAQFMHVLLNNGKIGLKTIIDQEIITTIETPLTSTGVKYGMKLGNAFGVSIRQRNGMILLGHGGYIDGFIASFYYNRSLNVGVIVLLNSHPYPPRPSVSKIQQMLLEHFFSDQKLSKEIPIHLGTKDLKKHQGFYRFTNPRFKEIGFIDAFMKNTWIKSQDDHLELVKPFDANEKIFPLTEQLFKRSHELTASFVIAENAEQQFFMHEQSGDYYLKSNIFLWLYDLAKGFFILGTLVFGLLYVLYFVIKALFKTNFRALTNAQRLLLIAIIGLAMMLASLLAIKDSRTFTSLNIYTVSYGCFSFGFLAAVILSGIYSFKNFLQIKNLQSVGELLLSLSLSIVAITFLFCGIIGFLSWVG